MSAKTKEEWKRDGERWGGGEKRFLQRREIKRIREEKADRTQKKKKKREWGGEARGAAVRCGKSHREKERESESRLHVMDFGNTVVRHRRRDWHRKLRKWMRRWGGGEGGEGERQEEYMVSCVYLVCRRSP